MAGFSGFAYRKSASKRGFAGLPEAPFGQQSGKAFTRRGAAFLRGLRFDVQHRGLSVTEEVQPNIITTDNRGNLVQLNQWESVLFRALSYMKIAFQSQAKLGRRNSLGSGNVDFLLWDYRLVLDPLGPFHFGTIGEEKDFWRTATRAQFGLVNVGMYEWELTSVPRCISRLKEILANPTAWAAFGG